jgi:para-nitrobenzyl esterase
MKKIYSTLFTLVCSGVFIIVNAQCAGERYFNYVFPANPIVTSNVTYGSNVKSNGATESLELDIYEPNGDSLTPVRPLVLIAHGGSFVGGSKTGTDVVPICKDLAKLGYVAVAIEYRLGMTNFPIPGPDSSDATEAVMRGVHDGRAAVRYFRKLAAVDSTNIYRIDTNNIFFAGVSAGGFIALQMAYLDEVSEIPSFIDMAGQPGLTGGLQGNSGNPGYSSEVKAIINMCGALGDTAWMKAGDEPIINFHGTNDGTVPYGSDLITLLGFYPLLKIDGSFSVNDKAVQLGIPSCFEIYEGQDHVPATTNAAYYDTTIVKIRTFLNHFVCGSPLSCVYNGSIVNAVGAGVEESVNVVNQWSIYPNPANNNLMVDLRKFESQKLCISIFNAIGEEVLSLNNLQAKQENIDITNLSSGLYQVIVSDGVSQFGKKLVKN